MNERRRKDQNRKNASKIEAGRLKEERKRSTMHLRKDGEKSAKTSIRNINRS